jgi:hypothetical protein
LSQLRSGRGASRTAAARGGTRTGGVFVQTPRSDIFVVMLAIALGAIVLGSLLLVLVLNRYGFQTKPTAMASPPTVAVATLSENLPDFRTEHL